MRKEEVVVIIDRPTGILPSTKKSDPPPTRYVYKRINGRRVHQVEAHQVDDRLDRVLIRFKALEIMVADHERKIKELMSAKRHVNTSRIKETKGEVYDK